MQKALKMFGVILLLAAFAGCSEDNTVYNPMATGTLNGTVSLQPGLDGSLDGTQIRLYRTDIAINTQIPRTAAVTDIDGYFEVTDVCCGNYLVIAWKDNNSDGFVGSGDFYTTAAVGSSGNCCVEPGKITTVSKVMGKLQ